MNKVPRWVFRYVGNKTFDFSSKKKIFCPKTTEFGPKFAFLSIAGSFGALLVGWLVVVARAVSPKTPMYFMYTFCEMTTHIREEMGFYVPATHQEAPPNPKGEEVS